MSKSKGVPKEAAPVAPVVEEKKAEPVPVIRPLEPPKRLSPEQLAATERAYVSAVGAGGALAVTALRPALASMGVDVRPDLAPIIFRAADEDSGGSLSLVEFQHLYARAKSLADIQLTPQQVRRVVSAVCVSVCLCLVVCVASVWNHRVIGRGLCLVCILLLAVAGCAVRDLVCACKSFSSYRSCVWHVCTAGAFIMASCCFPAHAR